MSTHNIYFYGEIRKISTILVEKKNAFSGVCDVLKADLTDFKDPKGPLCMVLLN